MRLIAILVMSASLAGCRTTATDRRAAAGQLPVSAVQAAPPAAATSSAADAAAIDRALGGLVQMFGSHLGTAAAYGNASSPTCKVYVSFLDDGSASSTPGVRVAVEHINYLVVTARADFAGFRRGITPLLGAQLGPDGSVTLLGPAGAKLLVAPAAGGRPLVEVNGLRCTAATQLLL